MDARELVERLGLQPHPLEGGFFRETYRSDERLAESALPDRYTKDRAVATAIYYLLTPDTFSAMHRLASDEVFHFYAGDPVEMLQLHPDGSHKIVLIGNDVGAGQQPQIVVPKGTWQGCRMGRSLGPRARSDAHEGLDYDECRTHEGLGYGYALLGTTVAPGFDPEDYEHGDREALSAQYPESVREMIRELTRNG